MLTTTVFHSPVSSPSGSNIVEASFGAKYMINSQQAFEMRAQIQNIAPNVWQNKEEGCTKQAQVDGRRTLVVLLLDILNACLLSALSC